MGKMQPKGQGTTQNLPKSSPPIRIMPAGLKISPRPASVVQVRGASQNRIIAREIRRENFMQGTPQNQMPARYSIRPMNPPLKSDAKNSSTDSRE